MLYVKDANHFFLFDHEHGGGRDRGRRPYSDRLTCEASLTKKIAWSQDRHNGFFTAFIDYRKPHSAFLNIENIFSGIALRENRFLFLEFRNLAGHTCGVEKSLSVESRLAIGFRTD